MLSIILAICIIFTAVLLNFFYFKPKRQIQRYDKLLTNLGYKTYVLPVKPMSIAARDMQQQDLKNHKDAFYSYKHKMVDVDFMISNMLHKVTIRLINTKFVKELVKSDKVQTYPKLDFMFRGFISQFGDGILFGNGELWRSHRKIISKLFTFDLITSKIGQISHICDKAIDQMERKNTNKDNGFNFSVKKLGQQIMSEVMLSYFFGLDNSQQKIKGQPLHIFALKISSDLGYSALSPAVMLLGGFAYKWGVTKYIKDVAERCTLYRQVCCSLIEKKRNQILSQLDSRTSGYYSDIIEALVMEEARLKDDKIQTLSSEEIFKEYSNFFMAGTETTSALMQMMVLLLAWNPEKEAKLRKQMNQIIKSEEDITYSNLKRLVYIDWVQNQSLRLANPAPGIVHRVATKDDLFVDVPISKGTVIFSWTVPNRFNPRYFKDPFKFEPQRWADEKDIDTQFALFAFSGGPRNCIGKHLALLASKIALVKLLRRYPTIRSSNPNPTMINKFVYEPQYSEPFFSKEQLPRHE